jgi:hypothetical protein
MTYRDIPQPPQCPLCCEPTKRNTHLPEQLGPFECEPCALYCVGTQSEYERLEPHRKARRRLKAEAEERAAKEAQA